MEGGDKFRIQNAESKIASVSLPRTGELASSVSVLMYFEHGGVRRP